MSLFPSLYVLHSSEHPMLMLHVNYSLKLTTGNITFINNKNLTREADSMSRTNGLLNCLVLGYISS